jgi:hypothetical protein
MIKKSTKNLSDQLGLVLEDTRMTNYPAGERIDYTNRAIRFVQAELLGLNDESIMELYFTEKRLDADLFAKNKEIVMPYDFETAIRLFKEGEAYPIRIVSEKEIDRVSEEYDDDAMACFYASAITPSVSGSANVSESDAEVRGNYIGTYNKKYRIWKDTADAKYDLVYLARPVRAVGTGGNIRVWSESDLANTNHTHGQTHEITVDTGALTFDITAGASDIPVTKEWQRADSGLGFAIWVCFSDIDDIDNASEWTILESYTTATSLTGAIADLVWYDNLAEGIEFKFDGYATMEDDDEWFFSAYHDREPTILRLNFQPSDNLYVNHTSTRHYVDQIDDYTFLPFPAFFDAIFLYVLLMCRNRNEENFQMDVVVNQPVRGEVRVLGQRLNKNRHLKETPDENYRTSAYM